MASFTEGTSDTVEAGKLKRAAIPIVFFRLQKVERPLTLRT